MKKVIVTSGWAVAYPEGGGMQWLNLHYLAGLRALGIEGYWLDVIEPGKNVSGTIEEFGAQCERFGFGGQWAVLDAQRRVHGMNARALEALCADCDLLINLSGALQDDDLLRRIRRRAYFDLDPGFMHTWAHQWDMGLSKHNLFFTVGLNVGQPDFPVPLRDIVWETFVPPVALEFWPVQAGPGGKFTTVGQWRGQQAAWQEEYYGPKREEFLKFAELPRRVTQPMELAILLHESETEDIAAMRGGGWLLTDPHTVAGKLEGFRQYIQQSRAEFTVAKGGYVKSRSGWFSDRSVCYLASGRPVIMQDTGFSKFLPTGRGLLTFTTMDEAVIAINAVNADYAAHATAARKLAEERFAAPNVLQSLLERAGVL
jgi:hypothetical protein